MATGTTYPVKNSTFTFGIAEAKLSDCNITLEGDLPDITTSGSGGQDELAFCLSRGTVSGKAPYVLGNAALSVGQQVTFTGTIFPGGTPIAVSVPVKIQALRVIGNIKDVWRFEFDAKSSGTFTAALT